MKDLVAIVSSPLQLINLSEYIVSQNIKNYSILILYYSDKELNQLNSINKIYNLDIDFSILGRPIFQYLELFRLSQKFKKIKEIVIGNFFSDPHIFFLNSCSPKKVTLIDDGMIVHEIPNFIGTNRRMVNLNLIKKTLNFFGLFEYPSHIKLYTIFDLIQTSNINLQHNKLPVIKSKISKKSISKKIIIIGQPLIEKRLVKKDSYLSVLKKIINNNIGYEILYFPNRKENKLSLDHIKNLKKIKIVTSNDCLELFISKSDFLPSKIIGFTSTALYTIDKIFNSTNQIIEIQSYKLKLEHSQDTYNNIYENGFVYDLL